VSALHVIKASKELNAAPVPPPLAPLPRGAAS